MGDLRWLFKLRFRLRALTRRHHVGNELDEEFLYHLDQRTEREIAKGLPPEDARRVAVRAMGGIEQVKEECRDILGVSLIEAFSQDFRYAFRCIGRNAGFTMIAIVTLSIGIGATIAILTVINSVLFRSLPLKIRIVW